MSDRPSPPWLTSFVRTAPLRRMLIVPFVVQIVGIVGLVGYFSYENGKQAVNHLVVQLQSEIDARIEQSLVHYLGGPVQLNQLNVDAYESGQLNLQDFPALGKYFARQLPQFGASYIQFATARGEYIGAGDYGLGRVQIEEIPLGGKLGRSYKYETNAAGDRTQRISVQNYDPRVEAWYSKGIKAGKPVWSAIYNWDGDPEILSIAATYPLYDRQHRLLGAFGTDLSLTYLSQLLRQIRLGTSGKAFIVERSGLLVASSTSEAPFRMVQGAAQRLSVLNSQDPILRQVAAAIAGQWGSFTQIRQDDRLQVTLGDQRYFVMVSPWHDKLGLDWIVTVILPESDFMAEIQAANQKTVWLCGVALLLATGMGLGTAQWIARPLLQLNRAAQRLADGDFAAQGVIATPITEVRELSQSFKRMAEQLQRSFAILTHYNTELGQEVAAKTQELRQQEARFRAIVESQTELIIRSRPDGILTFVNEAFCRYFGVAAEAILGQSYAPLIAPEDRDRVFQRLSTLSVKQPVLSLETRVVTPESVRWTQWNTRLIVNSDNRGIELQAVGRDITERKQAEAALAERERYLSTLVQVKTYLLSHDADTTYYQQILQWLGETSAASRVYLFENHQNALGHLLTSQRSEWCAVGVAPEIDNPGLQNVDYSQLMPRWVEVLSQGQIVNGIVADFPDGERELLEPQGILAILVLPLRVNGQFWGFIGFDNCAIARLWQPAEVNLLSAAAAAIAAHLERQHTRQELIHARDIAEAASLAKSQFLTHMSHELRTPLNAIIGFSQLLAGDSHLPREHREFVSTIHRSGDHLLSLIDDVLEMSKIEAGQVVLHEKPFHLPSLLATLMTLLQPQATDKGLALHLELNHPLPEEMVADDAKLSQVLINLLGNALKFTTDGTITLRVGVLGEPDQGDRLGFWVQDTGPGIAAEELETIFEMFGQSETGKRSQTGTGLGLAISQHFVQLMGGELTVESTLGVGSTFHFQIPLQTPGQTGLRSPVSESSSALPALPPPSTPSTTDTPILALVVDDNIVNCKFALQMLKRLGYQGVAVHSGEAAIALLTDQLHDQPFPVILMDVQMPGIDGVETTQRIRTLYQNRCQPWVIGLTADISRETRDRCLANGMDAFLCKPVKLETLHTTLQSLSQAPVQN